MEEQRILANAWMLKGGEIEAHVLNGESVPRILRRPRTFSLFGVSAAHECLV